MSRKGSPGRTSPVLKRWLIYLRRDASEDMLLVAVVEARTKPTRQLIELRKKLRKRFPGKWDLLVRSGPEPKASRNK